MKNWLLPILAILLPAAIGCRGCAAQSALGTALITGSDGGIGFALVQEFESRGWKVIATVLDPAKATELNAFAQAHPLVSVEKLDVTDAAGMDALAIKLKDKPIDALVNNAGITGSFEGQTLSKLDMGQFERVMRVNSYGPLRVSAAFLDLVARSKQRKIIAVSSGYGSVASVENIAASGYPSYYFYAMSKAALNMGMREFALEAGAPRSVTTVLISPGAVDTPMQRDIRANMERLGKPITAPTSTPAQVAHCDGNGHRAAQARTERQVPCALRQGSALVGVRQRVKPRVCGKPLRCCARPGQ